MLCEVLFRIGALKERCSFGKIGDWTATLGGKRKIEMNIGLKGSLIFSELELGFLRQPKKSEVTSKNQIWVGETCKVSEPLNSC